MALSAPTAARKLPDRTTIAFAISIVQSKPDGLTVEGERELGVTNSWKVELTATEYIHLLREHIASGRRQDSTGSTYRYFDGASYWRAEFERVTKVLKASEDKTLDLSLEVEKLKAKGDGSKRPSTAKRKKVDEDVILAPRSPKRSKRDPPEVKPEGSMEAIADFDFTGIGQAGQMLMRSFYYINVTLKSKKKPEAEILAQQCVRAASALPQIISRALQEHRNAVSEDFEGLKLPLAASRRAMLSLTMAHNRLSHVVDGASVQGQVTYAYVQMYSKLLNLLSEVSAMEVAKFANTEPRPTTATGKKTAPSKSKTSKAANIKDNSTLNMLALFLSSIVDNLDAKNEAHKALFEGYACVVLERLGSRLYDFAFGHQRGETMEAEISASNTEDEIEDSAKPKPDDQASQVAKLEAPYLVHVLNHIMKAAPAHLGAALSSKTGKAKVANNKGSMKGALTVVAKARLQRTFVNCIFGTEGAERDGLFMDCLKKPAAPDAPISMPKIKPADVQEWFMEQMWDLLGWEILTSEEKW